MEMHKRTCNPPLNGWKLECMCVCGWCTLERKEEEGKIGFWELKLRLLDSLISITSWFELKGSMISTRVVRGSPPQNWRWSCWQFWGGDPLMGCLKRHARWLNHWHIVPPPYVLLSLTFSDCFNLSEMSS